MTQAQIDLYYWPTPNGFKISIALEEMGLPYQTGLIAIGKGDQFQPDFLKVSPNNKIPAITDPDGPDGAPIHIFESGAILQYLARKTGQFCGRTERERIAVDQWLMWQMGGVGPMAGQTHHFLKFAKEDIPYAKNRYRSETARLYGVLDKQLERNEFIAGDFFSIADMATWPWAHLYEGQEQTLEDKPHFHRWLKACAARPGVQRGRMLEAKRRPSYDKDRPSLEALFGTSLDDLTL